MVTEKINEYITIKDISMYAFENSLGVSRGSISKAVKENKSIGSQVLENILSTYAELNPDWLLTGNGSMLRTGQDQPMPLEEVKPVSPADESIIYKMYSDQLQTIKEKDAKIDALNAKMLKMAEEIGSLKRDIDFLVHQRGIDVPPALNVEDAV